MNQLPFFFHKLIAPTLVDSVFAHIFVEKLRVKHGALLQSAAEI